MLEIFGSEASARAPILGSKCLRSISSGGCIDLRYTCGDSFIHIETIGQWDLMVQVEGK